jgi:hypothetical protein
MALVGCSRIRKQALFDFAKVPRVGQIIVLACFFYFFGSPHGYSNKEIRPSNGWPFNAA